jgi:hypothetical protein
MPIQPSWPSGHDRDNGLGPDLRPRRPASQPLRTYGDRDLDVLEDEAVGETATELC